MIKDGLETSSMEKVKQGLSLLREVQERIIVSQLKMYNASNPKNYVPFVRPWIFGYKNNPDFPNGVVFDGCFNNEPQFLRGETGAQSTIIPSMDIVLGITHKDDPLRAMLRELENYRPKPQRQYLESLRQTFGVTNVDDINQENIHSVHKLRKFVSTDKEACLLLNECVMNVFEFRSIHVAYADVYIARYTENEHATGGTPYKAYLRKHRDESIQHQVNFFPESVITKGVLEWDSKNNKQTLEEIDRAENGIPAALFQYYKPLIEKYGNNHICLQKKQFWSFLLST